MMTDALELDRVQRWMQAVIMHPGGAAPGIDSETARALLDICRESVERVINRSDALTSLDRLQIYAEAYYARLLECLRSEFPALVHALGEQAFDGLAFGYLQQHPSSSYTLARLGEHFPGYLERTRPPGESTDWPQFLIDLAILERTYGEVFDGPGVEGQKLLSTGELAAIPAERWADVHLRPVPCLRLLELQFPVHEYASRVRRREPAEIPGPQKTWLAVMRRDFIVRRKPLCEQEFAILADICAGESLGEALVRGLNSTTGDVPAESLRNWFRTWSAEGFFVGAW